MKLFTSFALLLLATSVIGKPTNGATNTRVVREFNNTATFTKIIPSRDLSYRDTIYITPALMFVGKSNGDILRCLHEDPSICEMFYSYSSSTPVKSMLISGEYLYASLNNGVMLRCNLYEKNSCTTFNSHSQMNALAVTGGYIHAGLNDGRMLRCELHQPSTCRNFNSFNSAILSLAATEKYIYAGLASKEIWRCPVNSENSCRLYDKGSLFASEIQGLSAINDAVIGVTKGGTLWNCTKQPCLSKSVPGSDYTNTAVFDGSLYTVQSSNIWVCKWKEFNCSLFDSHAGAVSIAFAYATYKMQDRFANEGKTCVSDGRCPPFMIYYNVNERPILEVFVKGGKLFNSQGVLVDTREADMGYSGRAAIFAMSADGQILVSNVHNTVLQTSSLFSGYSVAGAGEMVVENGVIRSIKACSEHYKPDVELNQQVINLLKMKGYTERIESLPCCTDRDCGQANVEDNTVADIQ